MKNNKNKYCNFFLKKQQILIFLLIFISVQTVHSQQTNLQTQPNIDKNTYLIAHYKFDNNTLDSFGNYHGTVQNITATQGIDQKENGAYKFNRHTSNFISLPNTLIHQKNQFSICTWINFGDKINLQVFISGTDDGSNRILLGIQKVYINEIFYDITAFLKNNIIPDQWYHFCFSYDSPNSRMFFYLDGQLKGSLQLTQHYTMNILEGGLIVGQDQDTLGGGFVQEESFLGKIQNLKFFDKPIFPNQAYQMFIEDRGDCTHACTQCNNNGECTICRGNRLLIDGKCLCPQGLFEDFTSQDCQNIKAEADDGLEVYYPMRNNATDVINNQDGNIIDLNPGVDRYGNPANALDFPYLITSQFQIPHTILNQKSIFSISCWFYRRLQNSSTILLSLSLNGANDLVLDPKFVEIIVAVQQQKITNIKNIIYDQWVHIIFSIDTNELKMYINGDLYHIYTKTNITFDVGINGLLIGQDQDVLGGGFQLDGTFNGIISDYQIYYKAITHKQAKQIYQTQAQNCPFGCEACFTGQIKCASCKGDRYLAKGQCICEQGFIDDQESFNCIHLQTQINQGLNAYYPLHDNVTDAINGYNGTSYEVTSVPNRFDQPNTSYQFVEGTQTYLSIPKETVNGNTKISFTLWYKKTQIDQNIRSLISLATQNYNNYLFFSTKRYQFEIQNIVLDFNLHQALLLNQWYHLILSIDFDQIRIYLNGQLFSTQSKNPQEINIDSLIIGQDQDTVGGGFDSSQSLVGCISDLRIYNKALNDIDSSILYYSEAYPCPFQCLHCLLKDTKCFDCKGNRQLINQDCKCPDNYYDDHKNENCQNCVKNCKKCNNSISCIECVDTNRSPTNQIICSCNSGYYEKDPNNMVCYKCENKCLTCEERASSCQQCKGLNRNQDPPYCTCQHGFYHDPQFSDCQKCAQQCDGCRDNHNQCIACQNYKNSLESNCLSQKKICENNFFLQPL